MKTIQSVDRAMAILDALSANADGLTLAELARRLELPPPTLHGFVATLRRWEMVEKDAATGRLVLGGRILRLARSCDRSQTLIRLIHPYLVALAEKYDETVHMAVPEAGGIVYLDKVECRRPYRMTSLVGTRETFFESAIGLALAAHRPEWNGSDDERRLLAETVSGRVATLFHAETEITCLAVALLDRFGHSIAGISLAVPKIRFGEKLRETLVADLIQTAERIERSW